MIVQPAVSTALTLWTEHDGRSAVSLQQGWTALWLAAPHLADVHGCAHHSSQGLHRMQRACLVPYDRLQRQQGIVGPSMLDGPWPLPWGCWQRASRGTPDASCSAWACRRRAARLRCQLDGLAARLALFLLGAVALLMSSGAYVTPAGMPWHRLTSLTPAVAVPAELNELRERLNLDGYASRSWKNSSVW